MSQISLYLFGPPRVEYAARPVTMRLQKEMALLVYLAETSRAHTRMMLATLFWPELDQSAAFAALRRTLYQLKSDVGENLLDRHGCDHGLPCFSKELSVKQGIFASRAILTFAGSQWAVPCSYRSDPAYGR